MRMSRMLVAAGLLACSTLFAQTGQPKIAIDPVADVGDVAKGSEAIYTYNVRNEGNAPLEIKSIQPSCGCTLVEGAPQTIAPGKSGKFTLRIDTNKVSGAFSKNATVTTNDPVTPTLTVTLKGNARDIFQVGPRQGPTVLYQGQPGEYTWDVTVADNTDVSIKSVSSDITGITASYDTVTPGKAFRIKARTTPASVSQVSGKITVATSHPKQPTLNLDLNASIRPAVTTSFEIVFLNATQQTLTSSNPPAPKRVLVEQHVGSGLKITKVDSSHPFIKTNVTTEKAGTRFYVDIWLDKSAPLGRVDGTVTIHTNHGTVKELQVKVKGNVT